METAMVQVTADKISAMTQFKAEEIAVIKATVAKGTTNVELAYFLSVCKSNDLNPFMKEIWCYKNKQGDLLVFAGRDGFLKRAQQSPRWNGMTSFEVCKNDDFAMNVTTAEIHHVPNFQDRGVIIGAYAIVKPKNCELATVEWADFAIYNKGYNVWKSDPAIMIKKVAETHALKKAFGITVVQSEYDFDVKNEIAVPIQISEKKEIDILSDKIIFALNDYAGDDKEAIRTMCAEKKKSGEFSVEFAQNIAQKLGLAL